MTIAKRWANHILKIYLLKGYALNNRIERIEEKLFEHSEKLIKVSDIILTACF